LFLKFLTQKNLTMRQFFFLCLLVIAGSTFTATTIDAQCAQKIMVSNTNNGQDVVDIAMSSKAHTTLVAAVKAAGLVETLKSEGPFTIFAPVNAAFDALPEGTVNTLLQPENKALLTSILTYHVVAGNVDAKAVAAAIRAGNGTARLTTIQGGELTASVMDGNVVLTDEKGQQATVTAVDLKGTNGVIHVIDNVVMPATENVVEIAIGSKDHTTLVAAVQAAGLAETLQGEGPFTIFAPTNAAFEALPAGTVESLLKPENKGKLAAVLTYHVVAGNLDATAVVAAIKSGGGKAKVRTIQGGNLTAMIKDGKVVLVDANGNTSTVIATDLKGTNGVIHVIDTVVLP
jgi:transforming growth factor-beta-induced protein